MHNSTIQIIKRGEGLNTEFKRTIGSPYKIAKTIVSFANTSGGVLLVGVGDNGVILGITSELKELEKLEKAATTLVDKQILLLVRSEKIDGRNLLRIDISESADKPHFALNEKNQRIIYIRVKDKSVPIPRLLISRATDEDLTKLLASRHVKTLIQFLRENDFIQAKVYARLINISDKRAERMLNDLVAKQVLLKVVQGKSERFSLKLSE